MRWWRSGQSGLGQAAAEVVHDFERSVGRQLPEPLAGRLGEKVQQLEAMLMETAGVLNTAPLVEQATADPRYRAANNRAVPRKIGSHLFLYDCINCDKCVPICPNDANFIYETEPVDLSYSNYRIQNGQLVETLGGVLKIGKAHQIANYADFCNDCGNCDVYCPEDGGPQIEKPRFFGSLETYRAAGRQGFYVEYGKGSRAVYGTLAGRSYRLVVDADLDRFDDGVMEVEIDARTRRILRWRSKPGTQAEGHTIELLPYLQLKHLLEAVSGSKSINYVNVSIV
jgi:putative selenate reductase